MTDPAKLRLDLPLVLPGIDVARDRCVARLIELLRGRPGIAEAHIVGPDGPAPELCIHYDPATLSLGRVRELAHAAGAGLSAAFGHLLITTAVAMQPRYIRPFAHTQLERQPTPPASLGRRTQAPPFTLRETLAVMTVRSASHQTASAGPLR